jgi:hypothetical protein
MVLCNNVEVDVEIEVEQSRCPTTPRHRDDVADHALTATSHKRELAQSSCRSESIYKRCRQPIFGRDFFLPKSLLNPKRSLVRASGLWAVA